MDYHIAIVTTIIIISGFLGGLTNFLYDNTTKLTFRGLFKSCLLGIVASLLVPLFLKMISSSLIDQAAKNTTDYFVLIGFCLVAAISSRSFIDNISKTVLNQIKERTDLIEKRTADVQKQVQPLLNNASEPEETNENGASNKDQDEVRSKLTPLDHNILNAFNYSKYTLRSVRGILKQLDLQPDSRESVRSRLKFLKKIKLVDELNIDSKSPKPRWYLTSIGKTFAMDIATSQVSEDGAAFNKANS